MEAENLKICMLSNPFDTQQEILSADDASSLIVKKINLLQRPFVIIVEVEKCHAKVNHTIGIP